MHQAKNNFVTKPEKNVSDRDWYYLRYSLVIPFLCKPVLGVSEESFSRETSIVSVIFQIKWEIFFCCILWELQNHSKVITIRWCPVHNAEQISRGTGKCLFYLHLWTDVMTNSFCRYPTGASRLALSVHMSTEIISVVIYQKYRDVPSQQGVHFQTLMDGGKLT